MTATEYIYVPDNGTAERSLSAREAASQKIVDDQTKEFRMTELLDQRGIAVPLWVVEGGYMIRGNTSQARVVSRLASENIIPSASEQPAQQTAPVEHITATFDNAAVRAVRARLSENFKMAAGESRIVPFGRKPSIRGTYGSMEMAA